MNSSVSLIVASLFYSCSLTVIFFRKEKINSIENKIFSNLIVINLVGLFIELLNYISVLNMNIYPIFNLIISKLYLVYLLTWIIIFTIYTVVISYHKKDNVHMQLTPTLRKTISLVKSIYWILILFLIFLPIKFSNEVGRIYSYGPSTDFIYIISILCITICIISLIHNFKNIRSKKYLPLFFLLTFGAVIMLLQKYNPSLLLITSMETFVTFLMYFTIENPDLKLIHELNIEKERADRANEAKTEFLSSMSHEIRTPLNAIVGFSNLLLEENIPPSAQEEVKDIIIASDNLLEIVNGILDISKIEANKLEIVNTEYKVYDMLEDLTALAKSRIGNKNLVIRTHFAQDLPPILYGDNVRLKQIILNLLTNSVKYTKEGTIDFQVQTIVKDDLCRLIISIKDTGIGIKKENVDKLFTKFERFDVEKNITIEGTGLGLAITKKLVDLMNGKIVVQSEYGVGSCFTVGINQKIVSTPTSFTVEPSSVVKNLDATGKKILLVDDNKINLKVATKLLESYHPEVTSVLSGEECLELIRTGNDFDLILLDDMMPHMSGVETFEKLKMEKDFHTPVVILTANAIAGMKEKYLQSHGFDDYLAKPIEKKEFERVLKKYLQEKGEC